MGGTDGAGFFDHSEYAEARKKGSDAIRRMILRHLNGTSVTVVLIGIHIHHLKNQKSDYAFFRGSKPDVPWGVEFPSYDWDGDLDRFRREIEAAGKRADALRTKAAAAGRR